MKKALLLLTIMMASLTASADEYGYLTFEMTDGSRASVSVSGLQLSISGTTLTAGAQQFTLSNLTKMYFSTTNESTTVGISEAMTADLDEATEVYDLQGRKISKEQMRGGIYVIKTKKGTFKVNVR